jgi:hypothetical protein
MTEDEKREAAAYLGENVLWLIEQILIKHNIAIIDASKDAIDAAVKKEREECAKICQAESEYAETWGTWGQVMTADKCAKAIRDRG